MQQLEIRMAKIIRETHYSGWGQSKAQAIVGRIYSQLSTSVLEMVGAIDTARMLSTVRSRSGRIFPF